MGLPRRALLLGLLALPAHAQVADAPPVGPDVPLPTEFPPEPPPPPPDRPVTVRLRPGGPGWIVRATTEDAPERLVRLGVEGDGAPGTQVILPSRYGARPPIRALPLRGREVILAEMPGNAGTGIGQTLVAVVAMDDAGRLRVIGIENLDAAEAGGCLSDATFSASFTGGEGGLEVSHRFARVAGPCAEGWRGRPHAEAWVERLTWDGRGALGAPSAPAGAGPVRRKAAEARARVAALLARPVTDLRRIGLERTGLFEIPLHGLT